MNITGTPYANLDLVTASPELSDLQSKLESKFKVDKLRKLLVELSEDYVGLGGYPFLR